MLLLLSAPFLRSSHTPSQPYQELLFPGPPEVQHNVITPPPSPTRFALPRALISAATLCLSNGIDRANSGLASVLQIEPAHHARILSSACGGSVPGTLPDTSFLHRPSTVLWPLHYTASYSVRTSSAWPAISPALAPSQASVINPLRTASPETSSDISHCGLDSALFSSIERTLSRPYTPSDATPTLTSAPFNPNVPSHMALRASQLRQKLTWLASPAANKYAHALDARATQSFESPRSPTKSSRGCHRHRTGNFRTGL